MDGRHRAELKPCTVSSPSSLSTSRERDQLVVFRTLTGTDACRIAATCGTNLCNRFTPPRFTPPFRAGGWRLTPPLRTGGWRITSSLRAGGWTIYPPSKGWWLEIYSLSESCFSPSESRTRSLVSQSPFRIGANRLFLCTGFVPVGFGFRRPVVQIRELEKSIYSPYEVWWLEQDERPREARPVAGRGAFGQCSALFCPPFSVLRLPALIGANRLFPGPGFVTVVFKSRRPVVRIRRARKVDLLPL